LLLKVASSSFWSAGTLTADLFCDAALAYLLLDADMRSDERRHRKEKQLYCPDHPVALFE
jgi:predicted secreted protein